MPLNFRGINARYEVKEVIGRGGMGVVYKAYDKVMKRPVALKTLLDLTDSKAVRLFQKECEGLASLIHPNIVEIFDVGQLEDDDGTKPYLVMALLPGVTLDTLIRSSSSRLTLERSIDIFCQTCRGLHAAHERGLIHRDLKPSNIFVMDDDSVKIIDFGIAHRLDKTQTRGRKGTLIYMSPEQIAMKPLTPASDLFSLGAVCYEALTLRKPFERQSEDEVGQAILSYIPPPVHEFNPSVPIAVSQCIHKAMAKEPLHRYRSAREFAETLQKALHNEPIEMFNPARLRPRLQRAHEAFEKGDFDYAAEILEEIESEGHLDGEIRDLRERVESARLERRISQLIETAQARMDEQEYQLALQKIDEALQLDPKNTRVLALKAKIDTRRTDRDIEGWFGIVRTHLENRAFSPAREALQRILELRPREPKAAQLLSEVERLEQNHQRLKEEKASLYRAAVEAERAGDLSSALTKLDRVLELDKQAPEPSRTRAYQQEYEKVHSEHESLKAARAEAKHLLDDQRFAQAMAICAEYLAKYPADTLLQALKWDIEEKHRQAISARIAETDRRVEVEPDLDRRVSILEQAVNENPGEAYFTRALQSAREKRSGVNTIVSRARYLEERGQFSEALAQWEMLQVIYSRYPGLRLEIERLTKRREQVRRQEAKSRWIEQIDQQLDAGEFARTGELLQKAGEEFPEDPELAELGRLARQLQERHSEAQTQLAAGREACARGRFAEGIEHLRHAHDLDGNDNQIRNVLVENLVEQGRRLMDADAGSAEVLLNEALGLEPNQALATGLLRMLADQRKNESIDRALAQSRRHQAGGELKHALDVVNQALEDYPSEPRLLQMQGSIQKSLQDARRKDLEQARRLAREVDTANDLNEERRGKYNDRLQYYMTRYGDDREFHDLVHGAKKRLETIVEARPRMAAMAADGSGGAAHIETPERTAETVAIESSKDGSPASPPKDGKPKATPEEGRFPATGRLTPWSSKQIYVGTTAAVAVLLLIAMTVRQLSKPATKPSSPPPARGSVAISSVPAGATISVNGERVGVASSTVTIRRAPGTYDLEASLPGYQHIKQKLTIQQGSMPPISIGLVPELPTLRIFGAGMVYLDSDPSGQVSEGQFQQQLTAADHVVRVVMSKTSELSFRAHVETDGLAAISEIKAREVSPLIVSGFGPVAKIYGGSNTPVPVQINGQKVGDLKIDGMNLPQASDAYDLTIGEGKDAKPRTIEVAAGRTILVLLEADPNIGRLLVQCNEDGATVVLLAGGRETARRLIQNHQATFTNVRVGPHSVRVSKEGYDSDNEKPVDIAKGTESRLSFDLRTRVIGGTFQVKTTPRAEVFMDGERVGIANSDGLAIVSHVLAGQHRVEAHLRLYATQAEPAARVSDGGTTELNLVLTRNPGTVRVQRDPSTSVVYYRRIDETAARLVTDNQLSLPEGTYVFSAAATGYAPVSANVVVRAEDSITPDLRLSAISRQPPPPATDTMAQFWEKGSWTQPQPHSWYVHLGEAFIGVNHNGPAIIEFSAMLEESGFLKNHKLIWATNWVDNRNYLKYELTAKELTITSVKDGKNAKLPVKPVKLAETYSIRLEWRTDSITVKINGETIQGPKGEYQAGRFGFLGNKEVRMSNFRLEAN
jgi:serine/threonine-protein kinase